MFFVCHNATCPRAGWCKRFSYAPKVMHDKQGYPPLNPEAQASCPEIEYEYYVRNKAREIYEREHPNESFNTEEPEQREHTDSNREPGVRENDAPYQRISRDLFELTGDPLSDRLLQFFASRSAGGGDALMLNLENGFGRVNSVPPVLQDTSLDGVPSARIEPEQPAEGE